MVKFSNFLKNGDVILVDKRKASGEPLVMKRKDSLTFILKFLRAYGIDEKIIKKIEKNVKEKWKRFDKHFRKTKYWENVKSFSEL